MSLPDRKGWYYRQGDPKGTLRWFNGTKWTNSVIPDPKNGEGVEEYGLDDDTEEPLPERKGWYQKSSDPQGIHRWFNGKVWTAQTIITGSSAEPAPEPPDSLAKLIPDLFRRFLDGADPQPVTDVTEDSGSWSMRPGSSLVTVTLMASKEIRITVGVAADVHYRPDVMRHVNYLNDRELVFGRIYLTGNDESGMGTVLMQEIVRGEGVSWDYRPTVENLLYITTELIGQADRIAEDLVSRFYCRSFRDDEDMFILLSQ